MKKVLAALALIMICMTSCSKKDKKSVYEKVTGRWTLVQTSSRIYIDGQLEDEGSAPFSPGDYLEFKNDGSVISHIDGETETASWSLANGDKQIIIGDEFDEQALDIKALDNNRFHVGTSETDGGIRFEMTIEMKK